VGQPSRANQWMRVAHVYADPLWVSICRWEGWGCPGVAGSGERPEGQGAGLERGDPYCTLVRWYPLPRRATLCPVNMLAFRLPHPSTPQCRLHFKPPPPGGGGKGDPADTHRPRFGGTHGGGGRGPGGVPRDPKMWVNKGKYTAFYSGGYGPYKEACYAADLLSAVAGARR